MRSKYVSMLLGFIFIAVLTGCENDEIKHIDPMVDGLVNNVDIQIGEISLTESWTRSLLGFREQRIKLVGIKNFMEKDGYSKDDYTLSDKAVLAQRVEKTLETVESKMDSVWSENIQEGWDEIDETSLGIEYFGSNKYARTSDMVSQAHSWLMADSVLKDETWISDDLEDLKENMVDLSELAVMDEDQVAQFVADVESKYAEMQQQYENIASEVENSGYFSKAQKELYASLDEPLTDMGESIEAGNLSLDTKDELNDLDRDLYALVYFVDNNYTSPAQKPKVYGEISSITELRWFSEEATVEDWNNTWVLTADIDAAETHRWNLDGEDKGFQQIDGPISIHFDGQYHIISGLLMTNNGGEGNNPGLFKNIQDGSIRNVGFINATQVKGPNGWGQGGLVAGWLTNVEVSEVFAHGKIDITGQSGSFLGRPQVGVEVSDCFSAVDCLNPAGAGDVPHSSSFIGLPVLDFSMKNVYTIGESRAYVFFGYPHSISLTASGVYYDSGIVGKTDLEFIDNAGAFYMEDSPDHLTDVAVDVSTSEWGDLGNFPEFSSDVWEINTIDIIDSNPRPYLKGFNYDIIDDFLIPEN